MHDLRQEIIETLIFSGPLTAQQLAVRFDLAWAELLVQLERLAEAGQVATQFNRRRGDARCFLCGDEVAEAEPGEFCDFREEGCQGYLVDDCRWVFCGGPVSQALSIAERISA